VHYRVHNFQEGRTTVGARIQRRASVVRRYNGDLSVGSVAWAALVAIVLVASRFLALQLALGALAVRRLHTLVGAI